MWEISIINNMVFLLKAFVLFSALVSVKGIDNAQVDPKNLARSLLEK